MIVRSVQFVAGPGGWVGAGGRVLVVWLLLVLGACSATSHPTVVTKLGVAGTLEELVASASKPGPIVLRKRLAARWEVDRAGLINLNHPTAQRAGIGAGAEPIELYFYSVSHPSHGTYLIDSGVARGLIRDGEASDISWLVRRAMGTDTLAVELALADWLNEQSAPLQGVLLTHIHLDHILGLADLPLGTPVYIGPGETKPKGFQNLFTRGTTNRLLGHVGALQEIAFSGGPIGDFAGVLDLFGDGSLWALAVPGHSPGSLAFVANTATGPHLILGDASHTRWGWTNAVEPGTFSHNQTLSRQSLAALVALAARLPGVRVHPGHQSLP